MSTGEAATDNIAELKRTRVASVRFICTFSGGKVHKPTGAVNHLIELEPDKNDHSFIAGTVLQLMLPEKVKVEAGDTVIISVETEIRDG